jgi:hypothetical protein
MGNSFEDNACVGCVSHVLSLKVWSQEDWLHTVRPVTDQAG